MGRFQLQPLVGWSGYLGYKIAYLFIPPSLIITTWLLQPRVTNAIPFSETPGVVSALGSMNPPTPRCKHLFLCRTLLLSSNVKWERVSVQVFARLLSVDRILAIREF